MKTNFAKAALRGAVCISAMASMSVTSAFAQADAPAQSGQVAAESPLSGADNSDIIIVTGTRIRQSGLQMAEPILKVDMNALETRDPATVADYMNRIPGIRGSVTPAGPQAAFGQGVNFLNVYNLGTNRTLVLVNGRRVVSSNVPSIVGNASPGTQVDINTIPDILLDGIDLVTVGGAPVYGTDAIAGTVNFRLKTRMHGVEARASSGMTSRGDNFRWKIAAAGGFDFGGGRGNLTAALSYDKLQGVEYNDRKFYRANISATSNPCTVLLTGVCAANNLVSNLGTANRTPQNDGRVNTDIGFNNSLTDGFPGSILIHDLTIPGLAQGGVLASGNGAYSWRFGPDGSLVPYNRGTLFAAAIPGASFTSARASGGDGFRFNDYNQITSNLKRLNANLFLTYDLTDSVRFFAESQFYEGQGDKLVQQPLFNASVFSGVSSALTFRVDNPFLTTQAKQKLGELGYTTTFQTSRLHDDIVDLSGFARSRLYRGVAGLDGHFEVAGRRYNFEAYLNYSRNDFVDFGKNVDQQRFVNAANVALVDGRIVCSATPTVTGFAGTFTTPVADPACQPLNLFGKGAPSQQARAYIVRDTMAKSRLEQFVTNVNVGGSPFDLFSNPVSFNLGYEHHAEKAAFTPDAFLQAGLGRLPAIVPTKGSYNLDELFGEVKIPVFTPRNDFVFSRLEFFARGRHVGSTVNGSFNSWAAGGTFAPIEDIELRGNRTRSFRAPSIVELYSPQSVGRTTVSDLCSVANINAGPVPLIRKANCDAFLAKYPAATPLAAASVGVPSVSGGNPNLDNEVADSLTYGVVVRPRFVPGLVATVDYIRVKINQPIASLTATQIVQGCFDNPTFNVDDPANGNIFCSYIKRDATGQVINAAPEISFTSGYVNGKRITMRAIQGSLDYTTGLGGLGIKGTFNLGATVFYLKHRLVDITGITPVRSDGLLGDPKWQGQLRLSYVNQAWGLSSDINYMGKQLTAVTNRGANPNDTREFDHYKPFATVDAALFITPAEGFRLNFSVINLFDRVGQPYYGTIAPSSVNDALGRRFAITASKKY